MRQRTQSRDRRFPFHSFPFTLLSDISTNIEINDRSAGLSMESECGDRIAVRPRAAYGEEPGVRIVVNVARTESAPTIDSSLARSRSSDDLSLPRVTSPVVAACGE